MYVCIFFFLLSLFPSFRFVSFLQKGKNVRGGGGRWGVWGGLVVRMRVKDLAIYMYCRGGGDPPNPPSLVLIFCMTIYTGSGNCQGEIGWGGSLPREFMIRAYRAR